MESLLPLLLIFAVMMLPLLFMSSRQRKAQQRQQELVNALGVGDEVRTHSGYYGLIVDSFDDVVVLENEDGSQTKWARQAIAMKVEDPTAAGSEESTQDAEDADLPADDAVDTTTPAVEHDGTDRPADGTSRPREL